MSATQLSIKWLLSTPTLKRIMDESELHWMCSFFIMPMFFSVYSSCVQLSQLWCTLIHKWIRTICRYIFGWFTYIKEITRFHLNIASVQLQLQLIFYHWLDIDIILDSLLQQCYTFQYIVHSINPISNFKQANITLEILNWIKQF